MTVVKFGHAKTLASNARRICLPRPESIRGGSAALAQGSGFRGVRTDRDRGSCAASPPHPGVVRDANALALCRLDASGRGGHHLLSLGRGKAPGLRFVATQLTDLSYSYGTNNPHEVAPGKSIGGDVFRNKEGKLPSAPGRIWYEADANYSSGYRGGDRILFSDDGLIYKTTDHYKTFTPIKGE
jgi:hypothetical protein